jgi:lambda family phage portal protein
VIRETLTRIAKAMLPRSYDGASGGRRWRGAGEMPFTLAAQQAARGPLAKRARYLAENNPNAAAGAAAWTSALVGTGIKPQSSHTDPQVRQPLNLAWEAWTDRADADELADAYGQQELAARRVVVDGDAFAVMSVTAAGELRVKMVDAEQVDPALHRELGGARIISGIEFDAAGRRVAYHMLRERPGLPLGMGSPLDTVRLPAADVAHIFKATTPGQVRGVSWFAPCLLRASEHDQAIDAQLVRQKVAALFAGFIRDANSDAAGFAGAPPTAGVVDGGLEPGTLKVLVPGTDITFSTPANIGAEAIDFLKITAREIAAGLGVPYEMLTGDLTSVNYSSIRAGLVEFRRRVETAQHNMLVFQLCRPIWRRFVTLEILSGRMPAPGFERDPEPYLSARWITPRFDWVDPAKDVAAEIEAIGAGLMSRRQAVAARGLDVEALDAELAADNARAAAMGLTFLAPRIAPRLEMAA